MSLAYKQYTYLLLIFVPKYISGSVYFSFIKVQKLNYDNHLFYTDVIHCRDTE